MKLPNKKFENLESDLSETLSNFSTIVVAFSFFPIYMITFWKNKRYIDSSNPLYNGDDVIKYLTLHTLILSVWITLFVTILF